MKEIAIVVLAFISFYGSIYFLSWFVEEFIDWFYSHTEGQRAEIKIQIVVSIVALCVMILLFG